MRQEERPYEYTKLGALIMEARKARHLSVVKLAKLTGVSRRHLVEIESGVNTTLSTLTKVMRALELTSLPLDSELTITLPVDRGTDAEFLLMIADQLERTTAKIIGSIRAFAQVDAASPEHPSKTRSIIRDLKELADRVPTDRQNEGRGQRSKG